MKILLAALALALPIYASAAEPIFGVGMALQQTNNRTYVEQVLAGAPVERDGTIKAGDEIVSVQSLAGIGEWIPVANLSLGEVVGMIRGEDGARVGLHMTNGSGQFEVFLTREKIELQ